MIQKHWKYRASKYVMPVTLRALHKFKKIRNEFKTWKFQLQMESLSFHFPLLFTGWGMSSLMITFLYLEQFLSFWHGQDQPDGKQDKNLHLWFNPFRNLALIILPIILKYYAGTNIYVISFLTSLFCSSSSVELFQSLQLNRTIKIVFKSSTNNFMSSSLKHNIGSQPP